MIQQVISFQENSWMQDPRCKHVYLDNLTERYDDTDDDDDESDKHL